MQFWGARASHPPCLASRETHLHKAYFRPDYAYRHKVTADVAGRAKLPLRPDQDGASVPPYHVVVTWRIGSPINRRKVRRGTRRTATETVALPQRCGLRIDALKTEKNPFRGHFLVHVEKSNRATPAQAHCHPADMT